ncbi:MAG: CDP-alcohol phosphatidyltransferase family protein [Christensenellales bacterium]
MKHLANLFTLCRIVLAAMMAFTAPLSPAFWGCYLLGGFSDVADGALARRYQVQTKQGARLDSAADFLFSLSAAKVFWPIISALPGWLWKCAACIFVLRLCNFFIARHKYRAFLSLHTYANKAAGALLFFSPFLLRRVGAAGLLFAPLRFLHRWRKRCCCFAAAGWK